MEDIDVKKLEQSHFEVSTILRCQNTIIDNLRSEIEHLHHIIEILITNQISQ